MQLNLTQQMKMSQQMKLAPRMIQSMEILQLPIIALAERIEQEVEENPALELLEVDESAPVTERKLELERLREESKPGVEEKELVVDVEHGEADFERLAEYSLEVPSDEEISFRPSANRIAEIADARHDALANVEDKGQTLHEYLLEQLHFMDAPPEIARFAEYLIENLDHDGRLQSTLAELVQVYEGSITYEQGEQALKLIQKMDPPGVGARDIRECLLLQVTDEMPHANLVREIIQHHLDDVAKNRLPQIQRRTQASLEDIKAAIEQLRTLEPHPGRGFDREIVQPVEPDVIVEKTEDGRYVVKVEDDYTPHLRISRRYWELARNGSDPKIKEFLKKKIERAKWLLEAIEQRKNTLQRVAQAIVDHQRDFFERGPEYIAPLKMQDIADVVGVHVTTVSRAVDDKWMQTPRGIFPLKRFFGGGTKTEDGAEVPWEVVRSKLKELIDHEDKRHPLSDEALQREMQKLGYRLARRTITKYRKVMGIPSARERREY